MNWGEVPTSLRPIRKREDLGLIYPCRWSPVMRELWHALVELGSLTLYDADAINWDDAREWVMTRDKATELTMAVMEFGAQVIIERKFRTEEGARNWMSRVEETYKPVADNVETHLWTIEEQK